MKLKKIYIVVLGLFLCSCTNNVTLTQTENNEIIASQSPNSTYKHSLHKIRKSIPQMSKAQQEEYVQRVGKKIAIVSDDPSTKFVITLSSSNDVILQIRNYNKIIISKGYLRQLKSEAQLAAVLGQIIAKLQHKNTIDKSSMDYIYRAGYDPKALSELQEYAINTNNHNLQIAVHTQISNTTVQENKKYANKFPKGLKTNEFDYQKNFIN